MQNSKSASQSKSIYFQTGWITAFFEEFEQKKLKDNEYSMVQISLGENYLNK